MKGKKHVQVKASLIKLIVLAGLMLITTFGCIEAFAELQKTPVPTSPHPADLINSVTVADVSSELAQYRAATYTIDGSGLSGSGAAGTTHVSYDEYVTWTVNGRVKTGTISIVALDVL